MLTKAAEILQDSELVREFMDIDSTSPESRLLEEIQKTFDALPADLPVKERGIFEKMARFRVRETFNAQMTESAPAMRDQFSKLNETLPEMLVRGQHLKPRRIIGVSLGLVRK